MKRIAFYILSTAVLFTSCKKDDVVSYNPEIKAELSIEFDNIAGSSDLELNSGSYVNAAGEIFHVTKLKYFVSNFILTNTDGSVFTVPQDSCYFLIDESDEETHEPILEVPEGEYKTLTFTLGVDSLRSTMDPGKRTGNLDPATRATDMYWNLNNGYIFFKMEGTSPAITSSENIFLYDIGGFGGYTTPTTNNLKTFTFDLTQRGTPKVKSGKETNLHLMVDILKALNGSTNMSFAATPMINDIEEGKVVADNYASMIKHDHTEN